MSYTEICEKFETVSQRMKDGGQLISTLSSFFKGMKKASETYAQQIQKLSDSIEQEISKEVHMDTLSTALMAFVNHWKTEASLMTSMANFFQFEMAEPLELFLAHFLDSNLTWTSKGTLSTRQLKKAQEKTRKYRNKYYQASVTAEKTEGKNAEYQRSMALKALNNYQKSIIDTNQKWDKFDSQIPEVMECLQQSEESRIHFLKLSVDKCLRKLEKKNEQNMHSLGEASSLLGNVSADTDIRIFVDIHKSGSVGVTREVFESYDELKAQKLNEEEEYLPEDSTEAEVILVTKIVEYLLSDDHSSIPYPAEYASLSELMSTADGRALFLDVLETKKYANFITPESMMQLAAITKNMLTSIVLENTSDPYAFCKTVILSQTFFTVEGEKRRHLSSFLVNHALWNNKQYWVDTIEFAASTKREADKECMKRLESQRKKGLFGTIKNFANKIPAVFQKDQRAEKSSVFMMASQFNFHMIHMGVKNDLATSIILEVSKKAGLDSERTCNLLAELQANQTPDKSMLLGSNRKPKNIQNYWQIFEHVFTYLPSKDILSALLMSKNWYSQLKPAALNIWLRNSPSKLLRTHCWGQLLGAYIDEDYYSLVRNMNNDPRAIGELADVIDMDVARSFKGVIDPDTLKNLLKTFAYHSPQVGYCQGMNYISGTLYLQLEDEEMAFKSMLAMVHKFDMRELFVSSLPKLKQFFFQLDRLIGMILPEVHEAFREIGICSGHFASSWFITIFSSSLQNSPETLLKIWDLFIVKGWKVVFRISVLILDTLSDEIIKADFDETMFLLNSINQKEVQDKVFTEEFFQRQVPVTTSLLQKLEDEYNSLKTKAEHL